MSESAAPRGLRAPGLRTMRLARGLTQDRLARLSETNQNAISRAELGVYPVNHRNIKKWAAALGCSVNALLDRAIAAERVGDDALPWPPKGAVSKAMPAKADAP